MIQAAFSVLWSSLAFYYTHILGIVGLALFAAVGRAIQLGWADRLPSAVYGILEAIVEVARVLIVLVVIWQSLTTTNQLDGQFFATLWQHLNERWVRLILSILIFSLFALLVNSGIRWVAHQKHLLNALQQLPVLIRLSEERLSLAVVFFLKNLTIIPFTLVWICYGLVRLLK